jgi:LemA protein
MNRFIQSVVTFVFAFLVISTGSLMSLKPVLLETRREAQADWDALIRAVRERNDSIPSLVEAVRAFEPGHAKLLFELNETRALVMRTIDPHALVQAINDQDAKLEFIEKMAKGNAGLEKHPPFALYWTRIAKTSRLANNARRNYNNAARVYNRLLTPFPQNMLVSVFGYIPLNIYPEVARIGE